MRVILAIIVIGLASEVYPHRVGESNQGEAVKGEGDFQLNREYREGFEDHDANFVEDEKFDDDGDDDDDDDDNDDDDDDDDDEDDGRRKKNCRLKETRECLWWTNPRRCLKTFVRKCKPEKVLRMCIKKLRSCAPRKGPSSRKTRRKCLRMYKKCVGHGEGSGIAG
ncbi:uncharacterized protein [Montipora foliosa]|uniref:uncharacterized protein n=1 Tax=Montipora foliosa TaxID=591990 RepID=UPI0035F171F2